MAGDGSENGSAGAADRLDTLELAALVYDDGTGVDAILWQFAADLRAAGWHVGGVVQMPPKEPGTKSPILRIADVSTGEAFPIKQDLGPGSDACSLDSGALAEASMRIRGAVDADVDVLLISKFGKQEAAGDGFRDEFGYAVARGVTVVTSVRTALVPDWQAFAGGLGTLIDCREAALADWWQGAAERRKLRRALASA